MKKRLIAGLAIGITILGMSSANALVISSTDAWQYSNISNISAPTIHSDSNALNMFGNTSANTESTNAVFNDSSTKGFWHTIEWTLDSAITLGSFNLVASHDGTGAPYYRDQNFRGFGAFKLEYKDNNGVWQELYSKNSIGITATLGDGATHPVYGGGVNYTQLWMYELYDSVAPTNATTWRASFQQYGAANYHASGPRILELDGYVYNGGTPVPEPSTILLLGTGLAGLAAIGRRKNN